MVLVLAAIGAASFVLQWVAWMSPTASAGTRRRCAVGGGLLGVAIYAVGVWLLLLNHWDVVEDCERALGTMAPAESVTGHAARFFPPSSTCSTSAGRTAVTSPGLTFLGAAFLVVSALSAVGGAVNTATATATRRR